MTDTCLELIVFKVKDPGQAREARYALQTAVKPYEGFLSWKAYEGAEEPNLFADLIEWKDLKSAKAAGEKVMQASDFKAVTDEMDGLVTVSHFILDRSIKA